jgi:hypothetical protein
MGMECSSLLKQSRVGSSVAAGLISLRTLEIEQQDAKRESAKHASAGADLFLAKILFFQRPQESLCCMELM